MAIDRRHFLAGLGAVALGAPARAAEPADFLAARGGAAGFSVARFAAGGRIAYDVPLPGRGHGFAVAGDHAVAVARRPGNFLLVFDVATGAARQRVAAAEGFFFCGHAVFDAAGDRLYATETCDEDGAGHIGVYDAWQGFRRIASWPTHGDDPHELLALDDDTLVVANGGFGPDGGPAIDPSLVLIDARDGRLMAQAKPPDELRSVSLRHLARADNAVFVAGQYAGPSRDRPPLVARWDGGALRFLDVPAGDLAGLANYCGSIGADRTGQRLCVASPHGGCALIFDLSGTVLQRVTIADVCGVAPAGRSGFLLSGGRGDIATTTGATAHVSDARWDNHITALA